MFQKQNLLKSGKSTRLTNVERVLFNLNEDEI